MNSLSGCFALLLLTAAGPLDLEGASLTPPVGFEPLQAGLFAGSRALVPVLGDGGKGRLLAGFAERRHDDGASLAVGRVAGGSALGRGSEGELASAIARHLRVELDLSEVTVEPAVLVGGPERPRLETRAHLWLGGESLSVRFALYPARDGYFTLAASRPDSRAAELDPLVDAAFDSFRVPPPNGGPWPRIALAAVLVLGIAGAAAGARRRQKRSAPDQPPVSD